MDDSWNTSPRFSIGWNPCTDNPSTDNPSTAFIDNDDDDDDDDDDDGASMSDGTWGATYFMENLFFNGVVFMHCRDTSPEKIQENVNKFVTRRPYARAPLSDDDLNNAMYDLGTLCESSSETAIVEWLDLNIMPQYRPACTAPQSFACCKDALITTDLVPTRA